MMLILDCDLIMEQAVELLEEVGLDQLSMRRLASRLDVSVSALYWHFKNKQDLLDHVAETLIVRSAPQETRDPAIPWWMVMGRFANRFRAFCLGHRDGARLFSMARPTNKVKVADFDNLQTTLINAGFTERQAWHAIMALTRYVLGHALAQQTAGDRAARFDLDEGFELGLQALLEGFNCILGGDLRLDYAEIAQSANPKMAGS